MKKRDFIGKKINVSKLEDVADNFALPVTVEEGREYMYDFYYENGQYTNAEILLHDFKINDNFDKYGYSLYSLKVVVDDDKVIMLIKVGHVHEGEEGTDFELDRFPHKSLEVEANMYMTHCCELEG